MSGYPVSDLDPFSAEYFADPYPAQNALRDAGPVVRLTRYNVWAVARYQEVYDVLNDWRTYSSARGVGLADFKKERPWRVPSLLLEADPHCTTAPARYWTRYCHRPPCVHFVRASLRLRIS
jgi:4-methoxybenzoate monooxygenase (O-demethylating)